MDPNTVRRLVRLAEIGDLDTVLEVGPGLGSLTLGLLSHARRVVAVEVDPTLAALLPDTAANRLGAGVAARLTVLCADALRLTAADLAADRTTAADLTAAGTGTAGQAISGQAISGQAIGGQATNDDIHGDDRPGEDPPNVLAANLPYNVAVPLLLELLSAVPSIQRGLVMVQAEVADRLTAPPGNRVYGVPTVKLAWYVHARPAGRVPRPVFWPEPNVDSGLVAFKRLAEPRRDDLRLAVFAAVDAAFAQRRKTLRSALAGWAGSAARLEAFAAEAGVAPTARGETLDVDAFVRLAESRARA